MVAVGVPDPGNPGRLSGAGVTTRFGFDGTDLCFMWENRKGYVHSLHGDTFRMENPHGGGYYFGSPVSLRTSNRDLGNGIRWDNAVGGDTARQIVPYTRCAAPAPGGQAVTHIPNDGQQLPSGDTAITTFAVRDWATDPVTRTWTTNFAAMWVSHQEDAEWYEDDPLVIFPSSGRYYHFQNQSMILWSDGKLYVFGTNPGRSNDGGIYLMRSDWDALTDESGWEFWGWHGGEWSWDRHDPTPILRAANPTAPNQVGEINAQIIEDTIVLSYTDYSIGLSLTQTAAAPDAPWSAPNPQIPASASPAPYAPAIHPWSTLADTHFVQSQWYHQPPREFVIYGIKQWHGPTLPIIPVPSSAPPDSGVQYYLTDLDDRGYPTRLPEGSPRGILDGVPEQNRAQILSELSGGNLAPEAFEKGLEVGYHEPAATQASDIGQS